MTTYAHPFLCLWCARLHGRDDGPMPVEIACDAYPGGVPDEILDNEVDHREPVEGDRGLRFVPIGGISDTDIDRMMVFGRPS